MMLLDAAVKITDDEGNVRGTERRPPETTGTTTRWISDMRRGHHRGHETRSTPALASILGELASTTAHGLLVNILLEGRRRRRYRYYSEAGMAATLTARPGYTL
jgi:hypothetical protein